MRVVMLSKALVVGAYRRKCELLAAESDIELNVVVPPGWGAQVLERGNEHGYALHVAPVRFNGNFHLHHYPALPALLRRLRPDLVHIDEEPYNLATFLALRAAQAVGARSLFFSWQNILRPYPQPFRAMEGHVLRRSHGAMAGNEEAKAVLQAKGCRAPVWVIPQFGVDEQVFRPAPGPRDDRTFTVGFAGRLVPEKGVELLLEAVSALPQAHVVIAGSGGQEAALRAQARTLGLESRVTFETSLSSAAMPAFYNRLDALVLPSRTLPNWKEQFGRVLIEAMACGVPVVGSSSGEIPNVIGQAGLVFPEGDVDALRAALRSVAEDMALRRTLSEAGLQRVQEHYRMQSIASATAQVYRRILAQ